MMKKSLIFFVFFLFSFVIYCQEETNDRGNFSIENETYLDSDILGVYRFKEFTQFIFNSRRQTPRQNAMSKKIFEEHFSDGAIIVGYDNKERKHYVQYSYPRYVKEYFEISSPIIFGEAKTGYIDDYWEYQISNDNIMFSYDRINTREEDDYKNLLTSIGVFEKINVTEYGNYSYSSHEIINERGRAIDIEKIMKAQVIIYKVENENSYVIYFSNPDEKIKIVGSLNGFFIDFLSESRSSHEYEYYFEGNELKLHVKDFLYREDTENIIHEYRVKFRSNDSIIIESKNEK